MEEAGDRDAEAALVKTAGGSSNDKSAKGNLSLSEEGGNDVEMVLADVGVDEAALSNEIAASANNVSPKGCSVGKDPNKDAVADEVAVGNKSFVGEDFNKDTGVDKAVVGNEISSSANTNSCEGSSVGVDSNKDEFGFDLEVLKSNFESCFGRSKWECTNEFLNEYKDLVKQVQYGKDMDWLMTEFKNKVGKISDKVDDLVESLCKEYFPFQNCSQETIVVLLKKMETECLRKIWLKQKRRFIKIVRENECDWVATVYGNSGPATVNKAYNIDLYLEFYNLDELPNPSRRTKENSDNNGSGSKGDDDLGKDENPSLPPNGKNNDNKESRNDDDKMGSDSDSKKDDGKNPKCDMKGSLDGAAEAVDTLIVDDDGGT